MRRECLVLWVSANNLLANASFDLSKAAKNLRLNAKLSLARPRLPIWAELEPVGSKSETSGENMMEG